MLEKIEAKINEKIEQILAKDEITMEDFQILTSEQARLKYEATSEERTRSMMEVFAKTLI